MAHSESNLGQMSEERIDWVRLEVHTNHGDIIGLDAVVDSRVDLAAAITRLATELDADLLDRGLWNTEPEANGETQRPRHPHPDTPPDPAK